MRTVRPSRKLRKVRVVRLVRPHRPRQRFHRRLHDADRKRRFYGRLDDANRERRFYRRLHGRFDDPDDDRRFYRRLDDSDDRRLKANDGRFRQSHYGWFESYYWWLKANWFWWYGLSDGESWFHRKRGLNAYGESGFNPHGKDPATETSEATKTALRSLLFMTDSSLKVARTGGSYKPRFGAQLFTRRGSEKGSLSLQLFFDF